MTADLATFDGLLRDYFPRPGERIKQYVVDERKRAEWERETCPMLVRAKHKDNTGSVCRNQGTTAWVDLEHHDCCHDCNGFADGQRWRPEIVAWQEKRERYHAEHPICADRSKLSDAVVPGLVLREPTMPGMLRGRK